MNVARTVFAFVLPVLAAWGSVVWFTGCAETSCERGFDYDPDCDACTPRPRNCPRDIPAEANLILRVSQPLPAEVRVFAGAAHETGRLIWSGVPSSAIWSMRLPLGDYAATALYPQTGDTVLAVDGDYVGYSETSYCEGSCFTEADGEVDLRLK